MAVILGLAIACSKRKKLYHGSNSCSIVNSLDIFHLETGNVNLFYEDELQQVILNVNAVTIHLGTIVMTGIVLLISSSSFHCSGICFTSYVCILFCIVGKKHKVEFQLLIDQMNKRKRKANKIKTEEKEWQQKEAAVGKPPVETGMHC